MKRFIFGLAAGVSSFALYNWPANRKCAEVSSVDDTILESCADSEISPVIVNKESAPSRNILMEKLEAELTLLKEETLRLKSQKDEASLLTEKLSKQLSEETSKNAHLVHQLGIVHQMYDREMDKIRAAHRDALIAIHQGVNQQSEGLQMDNTRLQNQIDVLSRDLIQVTAERDAVAAKEALLAEEVDDVKSKLNAALTDARDLQIAADSHDRELLELRAQLDASVARIGELESINCCQANKIAELEACAQVKSDPIAPKSVQPVVAPPFVQVHQQTEAPVFACSDIRYRNKNIEGYTVLPTSTDVSPKQDPVQERGPIMKPPPAKQVPLPNGTSCDFKVIGAVIQHELPNSYQLLNVAPHNYGHIVGKDRKNINELEQAHGVKISVSPPRGLRGHVRVCITQGNIEQRRNVAKKIVDSLPAIVEVPFASLGVLSPQRRKQLWPRYFVEITENESDKKWILRGKLGSCLRLFNEQKIQNV